MAFHQKRGGLFAWLTGMFGGAQQDGAQHLEARVARLEALNALLHDLASTSNVTALFKVLSSQIRDVVPCDQVAIALMDAGAEFQVLVTRSGRPAAAAESEVHHFLRTGTLLPEVAAAREPRLIADLTPLSAAHLDLNVLVSSGARSAMLLPLVAEGVTLGVLGVMSNQPGGCAQTDVDTLRPVADIVAVSFATQSLARALGRTQMAKDMADVLFSLSNDINGALQTIVGHCEVLSREYQDPSLQRDLDVMSAQARRATEVVAQVQSMAQSRLQRANSVANLLEDARLEDATRSVIPAVGDVLKR